MELMRYLTPTLLLPIAALAGVFCFFAAYRRAAAPKEGTLEWISQANEGRQPSRFQAQRHKLTRRDALPMLLLTAVYALSAFWSLGSLAAPETFAQLRAGETVTFSLGEEAEVSRILFYGGLNTGAYTLEASADGESWVSLWAKTDEKGKVERYYWADGTGYAPSTAMSQKYSLLFKWQEVTPTTTVRAKYFRITGRPDSGKEWLELGEMALFGGDGARLEPVRAEGSAALLFDEGGTVPELPTWYNSAYFDEIYHPRTAYEHLRNIYPYEISHPPLGKLIMSLGVLLFGMTPFGWRFMGTLFGVLMLPILYIFLKNLFGKTPVAFCGTALFAFDFMHLTQTRIGTIDTYGVFFILCMYFFMYRYLTLPAGTPFRKGALPLFLSGLSFGLGAASKWTVLYGAVGLAILYFIGMWFRWRDWPRGEDGPRFGPWLVKTLLFSVLVFVLIPAVIYTLSYLPYAQAKGKTGLGELISVMLENQKYMLTYHTGVHDAHPYASRWYQWLVDGRPILYYLDSTSGAAWGLKAAFGAFSNPLVCWGGLLAILTCAVRSFRRLWSKLTFFAVTGVGAVLSLALIEGVYTPEHPYAIPLTVVGLLLYLGLGVFLSFSFPQHDGKALFILVGYLAELLPWMLIGRTTFAYHYFPSILFLVLALSYLFDGLLERGTKGCKGAVYGLTGAAAGLYAAFYPVLVGIMAPTWYTSNFLRWLPSWPF